MRTRSRTRRTPLAVIGLVFASIGMLAAGARAQDTERAPIYTDIVLPAPGQTLDAQAEYYATGKVEGLAQYLGYIYNFLISVVGLVAAAMMVVGGFQYLTSAGDSAKIGAAKTRLTNAFMGLVLALGAYTILNTINPALLTFKPLNPNDVKSELIVMPWCDEITAAGTAISPVYGTPGQCGSVAEYMKGKSRLTCIYRSPCETDKDSDEVPDALRNSKGVQQACVQLLTTSAYVDDPLTVEDVYWLIFEDRIREAYKADHGGQIWDSSQFDTPDEAANAAAWQAFNEKELLKYYPAFGTASGQQLEGSVDMFASCKSCITYGSRSRDPSVDYTQKKFQLPGPGRCEYWQREANAGVPFGPGALEELKKKGKSAISYCRWMDDAEACAQVDIVCREPTKTSSCSNYNKQKPFYYFDLVDGGYAWWIYGGDKNGTLDSRPDALAAVCSANPCGYNMDGVKEDGCTGSGGIIDGIRTAATAVRDGIYGIQECESR